MTEDTCKIERLERKVDALTHALATLISWQVDALGADNARTLIAMLPGSANRAERDGFAAGEPAGQRGDAGKLPAREGRGEGGGRSVECKPAAVGWCTCGPCVRGGPCNRGQSPLPRCGEPEASPSLRPTAGDLLDAQWANYLADIGEAGDRAPMARQMFDAIVKAGTEHGDTHIEIRDALLRAEAEAEAHAGS